MQLRHARHRSPRVLAAILLLAAPLLPLAGAAPAEGQDSPRLEVEVRGEEPDPEPSVTQKEEAEEAPSTDFRPTESVPPGSSVSFPVDI